MIADKNLRHAMAAADSSDPRRGEVVLWLGGEARTGLISFRGKRCHIEVERLAWITIQQAGPRPYVRVQARAETLLLRGARDWMLTCLRPVLRLVAGGAAAAGWSPDNNAGRTIRWKTFRLDIACDHQGLDFDWTDVRQVVARQRRRGISKAPNEEGFEVQVEVERVLKQCDRDHLLDASGRGAELQTLQVGSLKSRTSMSLHRKDLAVRAHHGVAAADSFYATLLWEDSPRYDPEVPIWRAEMRFSSDGLELVERPPPRSVARDTDDSRRLSAYDLGYLVSGEGISVLWEFATRQIKLRAPGTSRARNSLDRRWVAIQNATFAPPFTVEQGRSKRARERALTDHLVAFVNTNARNVERAAALMNRAAELCRPRRRKSYASRASQLLPRRRAWGAPERRTSAPRGGPARIPWLRDSGRALPPGGSHGRPREAHVRSRRGMRGGCREPARRLRDLRRVSPPFGERERIRGLIDRAMAARQAVARAGHVRHGGSRPPARQSGLLQVTDASFRP